VTYPSFARSDAEVGVGFIAWGMEVLETAERLFRYTIFTVQILQGNNSCSKAKQTLRKDYYACKKAENYKKSPNSLMNQR
jgi:hypothetical protein